MKQLCDVKYFDDGSVAEEYWYIVVDNDKLAHREDSPAVVFYSAPNKIDEEYWCLYNLLHREDGPAEISYYDNGCIYKEKWYLNGYYHREDGPAITYYEYNGEAYDKKWFINDVEYTEDEFKKYKLIKELAGIET